MSQGQLTDPDVILKNILLGLVLLLAVKSLTGNLGNTKEYSGVGFSITKPDGWEVLKGEHNHIQMFPKDYTQVDVVTFFSPQTENNKPISRITAVGAKMATPPWLEDLWPEIVKAYEQFGYTIRDKGEIKIDDKIAKWILYEKKNKGDLYLEFFTVDDKSGIFKLAFVTSPKGFMQNRKVFDQVRGSFQFSRSLF